MNAAEMRAALELFDIKLKRPLRLIMGGGAAMLLMYHHPAATADVDAVPYPYRSMFEFEEIIQEIAKERGLPLDWLNPHFTDFTYVLPDDCMNRLKPYFKGQYLVVDCFGPEDMIVMKCMAGRAKDRTHLRKLIRIRGVDLALVEDHLAKLQKDGLENAHSALALLEELKDELT
jgi:predicted nucleotidyltransferase